MLTPEELHELATVNIDNRRDARKQENLTKVVEIVVKMAKEVILSGKDANKMQIPNFYHSHGLYQHEVCEELARLGYRVSEQTVGFEEESEDYWYLHFKLDK